MRLVLEVVSGPAKGRRIEAEAGQTISIGRTKKSNVALGDNFMSGVHFAVECRTKGCQVRDLKSRNGTKLNGELITESVLKDGDRLFAGRTDFIARVERTAKEAAGFQPGAASQPALKRGRQKSGPQQEVSKRVEQSVISGTQSAKPQSKTPSAVPPAPRIETKAAPISERPIAGPKATPVPVSAPYTPPARGEILASHGLEMYEAATPQGRLFQILSNQPQTVMALLDAVRDAKVIDLLRGTREEYQSLYTGEANAAVAPYLVRLPPRCDLLKQMIQLGWGKEWGVYLTCVSSLGGLRDYFRASLMVKLPDGIELFSRFYDPRFFRRFLETCTVAEAEKFFGPVTTYLMEGERPEILLEFSKYSTGVEKKGHLLSDLTQ